MKELYTIASGLFFDFYAELYKNLSKPVDIIDLSKKSLFSNLVEKRGIRIETFLKE